jgi:hypothetical protein
MRLNLFMAALLLSSMAFAKEPKHFESGTLLRMDSVQCGLDEKSGNSFAGEIIGTDSGHKKTQAVLCQEYVLQGQRLEYHIRPKDAKHPVLLPVGGKAQFRLDKDKMVLRVEDLDDKDRDYSVVSVTQREETKPPANTAVASQH